MGLACETGNETCNVCMGTRVQEAVVIELEHVRVRADANLICPVHECLL